MLPLPKEPPPCPQGSPSRYLPGPGGASRSGRVQPPRRPDPSSPRCSGGRPCSCRSASACRGGRWRLWSEAPPQLSPRRGRSFDWVPTLRLTFPWKRSGCPWGWTGPEFGCAHQWGNSCTDRWGAQPPLAPAVATPAFVPPVALPSVCAWKRPPWASRPCSLK